MPPLTAGAPSDWPLVGRAGELALVAHVMARGDRHGVVLAGPAGVGKTRFASECLAIGERVGFVTASAIATRAAAAIPFGALAPLLHQAPAAAERRIDVLKAVRESLLRRAGAQPLLLLVDDAHLLDDASATVLLQLAAADEAFVVVTVRTGERTPDAIVSLWKDEIAERVELRPIAAAEVERLIGDVLGGAVDGATLRALASASAGNLLYLREALRGAVAGGSLRREGGLWRLHGGLATPPSLADLIAAHLAEASIDERGVLELLAVGEPIGLVLVASMASGALVRGVEARGLTALRLDGRREQIVLAHPLYGDVVRTALSAINVRELQRSLADAVDATGARRKDDALRVATWRLESGHTLGVDVMVRAARHARAAFDLPLAERLAHAALASGGGVPAALVLSETLFFQGRYAEAEHALADVAPAATSDEEHARLALARAFNLYWGLGRWQEADGIAALAAEQIAAARWRHELQAERATYRLFAGAPVAALDLAMSLLDRSDVPARAQARARFAAVPALTVVGRIDEAVRVAEAGSGALRSATETFAGRMYALLLQTCLALAQMEAGRLADAEGIAAGAYEQAVSARSATSQAVSAWARGRVALMQGRVATAARWFREGASIDGTLGLRSRQRWSPGGLAFAAALAGDVATADAALAEVDSAAGADRFLETDRERARAWRDVGAGDLHAARARLRRGAEEAAARGQHTLEAAALHDLARLGDAATVAPRLAELTAVVDGELMGTRARHAAAAAARDGKALGDVAGQFAQMGALLLAAEAAAEATAAFRRAGDRRGSVTWDREAHRLADGCEGARTPALRLGSTVANLTRRESEIAHLAAAGRSSRDIAEQLMLSVRTVENHLLHVYEKLGVRGRRELADALGSPKPHVEDDAKHE